MDKSQNMILVLVGPKGCGKSHLGRMLEAEFDIHYLRLEEIWQELKTCRLDFLSQDYIREGRALTIEAIRAALQNGSVCIEASGVANDWAEYVAELRLLATVIFVRVTSSLEACRIRARDRDQSLQVVIDQDLFESINRQSLDVQMDWVATLNNEPFLSQAELITQMTPIFRDNYILAKKD